MISSRYRDAALLAALFSSPGELLSRQALARAANMSQDALPEALNPYIAAGYPIAFHPQGGISLRETPDVWSAEEILGRCPSLPEAPTWNPLLLADTFSTNDVAREQGRQGTREGFVVAAARQTSGRGRLGRRWESPANRGIYVSILLRPDWSMAEAGRLTILSSVAAADAVEAVCGTRPQIKWPNDLLINGRKLAGLLIETEPRAGRLGFAVIGIGINVRHETADFSADVQDIATSIVMATGQLHRRADVLVALLNAFSSRLVGPFAGAREAWIASSLTLGKQVTLMTCRGRKQGQAMGLDESGALLLRGASGEIETITAGDMQAN